MNPKDKTLHMIGNAHIDPVWLWRWDEGYQEVRATFRSALDRMNEYEDFIFTASSAAFYEWVEQSDPAMFEEIRRRVQEGRWQLAGGWWIEPDCNIPAGESFVRQGLYGQRYFQSRFGRIAKVGFNVDSFGHSAMLPQILSKSGLDAYVFMRPSPHEKGLPDNLFWWEADDGSRVLAFRILYEYCSWPADVSRHVQRCAAAAKPPLNETLCFYGVGNHGGGPTIENLENIRRMNDDPAYPHLVYNGLEHVLNPERAAGWQLPVVHDELQHHGSGCYAVHSGIKRWNRQAENALLAAEKFSVAAGLVVNHPYPDLAQAWKDVLFNQFHDIMAGTAVEAAYDDARDLYGEAQAIAGRGLNGAIQALAWNVRVASEPDMKPIIVFNPHPWPSKVNVEVEYGALRGGEALVDEDGQSVPCQVVQSWGTAAGRNRLSFIADLPSFGYRTYRMGGQPSTAQAAPAGTLDATATTLENARFRLEINPDTGCIRSLLDKQCGHQLFIAEAAVPVVIEDTTDTWGHNCFKFDRVVGTFSPTRITLAENGPVKAVLRVTSSYGASTLTQDFTMYRELDQIDVHVTVDWREQFKMLKLRFPANLTFMRPTYEIPYGHIQRFANGEEEPGQSWLDLSGITRDTGEMYGFSILNDGKYSFDVNVRDMGLTVLRSPVYANHMPIVPDPEGHYAFVDQGIQRFNYTILPHEGSWETAGTVRRAAELNQRPISLISTFHPEGMLPQCDSYLSVEPENVVVTVLKQAEDNDDLILRAYETNGVPTPAVIRFSARLGARIIETTFGASEIKTLRIPRRADGAAVETDMLEMAG